LRPDPLPDVKYPSHELSLDPGRGLGDFPNLLIQAEQRPPQNGEITWLKLERRFEHYLSSSHIHKPETEIFAIDSISARSTHLEIAERCLTHHLQLSESFLATKELSRRFPLWRCSARRWLFHLLYGPISKLLSDLVLQALEPGSQSMLNLAHFSDPDYAGSHSWSKNFSKDQLFPPLYYAVLIRHGKGTNPTSGDDTYTIVEVVRLLLDNGADVNAQRGHLGHALQAACVRPFEDVVELLLARGAEINAQGGYFGNALQAAAYTGRVKNVQLLLKKWAEVNAEGGTYGSALMPAAHKGRRTIVELLLNQSADINANGGPFGNVIQAAIANDKVDVVELLLSRGAETNITEELLMNVEEGWSKLFADRLRGFDSKTWIKPELLGKHAPHLSD